MTSWPDFELPDEWQIVPIGDLALKLRAGGTPSRKDATNWGGEIPFALIEDVTNSRFQLCITNESITESGLRNSSAWIVPVGTVLLTMYATIGATAVTKKPLATNQAIMAIVPKDCVDAEYLAFALFAYRRALIARNIEATQKNINKGIVSAFPMPMPPLPEQRKIAAVLSLVQRAIAQQERLIALTTELKKALMYKLFTEGLHGEPQKETEIGPVPESWSLKRVDDLDTVVQSGQTPSRKNRTFFGGDIKWVKTLDLNNGLVTETEEKLTSEGFDSIGRKCRPAGTVMVAMYGGAGTIGKCGILATPAATNQAVCCIEPNPAVFSSRFLLHYFIHIRRSWMLYAIGTRKDPNISKAVVEKLTLPFPPLDEQSEIARILDAVSNKVEQHGAKKLILTELFRTLLHQLMTAQIRVDELDVSGFIPLKETASAG